MRKRNIRRRKRIIEALEPKLLLAAQINGLNSNDVNGDGIRNPGEPGLEGWEIVATDVATSESVGPATTDDDGKYSLAVPAGTYFVEASSRPDWEQTFPANGPSKRVHNQAMFVF